MIDHTHDQGRRSWVASAATHMDFPLQNLPFGIFSIPNRSPRIGVAIGDRVLDLGAAVQRKLIDVTDALASACDGPTLNALMGLPAEDRTALRHALFSLLEEGSEHQAEIVDPLAPMLFDADQCRFHLPSRIGDYTDFYAGIHHAVAAGRLFRPDQPLLPNYKYMPVGYHGRSSTVGVAPARVRRPHGQVRHEGSAAPVLSPSSKLDYELEVAIWLGPGNRDGEPIVIDEALGSIFGFGLLNDWSSRDIQRWEAQPLGPFLSKNFATTVSPWVVTTDALAPFRRPQKPRPYDDPPPLPYLRGVQDADSGAFDIVLEVFILTSLMRDRGAPPERISQSNSDDLYWTPAQMVAHHSINGCILNPGDLLGSGTVSSEGELGAGCLLERTFDGRSPMHLSSGESRQYLERGDTIIFEGRCVRDGYRTIGFGQNLGSIVD